MLERMWTLRASMKYPRKWIVMVNIDWGTDLQTQNKRMGDVYAVTDTPEEAGKIMNSLGDTMGETTVIDGDDDMIHVGGYYFEKAKNHNT
ncbi:MAG: hypothetical protein FWG68_07085 [Defluviitaleaceae bacterium]|nr:hypothetical protein [Defluviitaleaceae bacterium]